MELIRNEKVAVNTVELEFKVGKDVFEPAVTKAFRKANAEITVPGFRKGKAPRKVVEKMYGEERLLNCLNNNSKKDIINTILNDVTNFVEDNDQFDDMTLLILENNKYS